MSGYAEYIVAVEVHSSHTDLEAARAVLIDTVMVSYPELENRYQFVKRIGSGSQATVDHYRAIP